MDKLPDTISGVEKVSFPELELVSIPARVDTGAKTSSIWASAILAANNQLEVTLFGPKSRYYTGEKLLFSEYTIKNIIGSTGARETRYTIKLLVSVQGRKIRALFTLANRSKQAYPVLIGRNVIRKKFLVDIGSIRSKLQAVKE